MNIQDIDAIGDYVIIKPECLSDNVIHLSDNARQKVITGTIVKLGTGFFDRSGRKLDFVCSVGDRVIYKWQAGHRLKVGDEDYEIVQNCDIEGMLE
jgi:co-chaperonin GroES (HSP10)